MTGSTLIKLLLLLNLAISATALTSCSKVNGQDVCGANQKCVNGICYQVTGPCVIGTCPSPNDICVNDECLSSDIPTTPIPSTTTDSCVDLAAPGKQSDCPRLQYLCNDPNYYDLMTKQCPKTCNRCVQTGTTAGACVDLAPSGKPSDCPNLQYLCQNPLYRAIMEKQCPKTCGYC